VAELGAAELWLRACGRMIIIGVLCVSHEFGRNGDETRGENTEPRLARGDLESRRVVGCSERGRGRGDGEDARKDMGAESHFRTSQLPRPAPEPAAEAC
jgi:hypothetical protein